MRTASPRWVIVTVIVLFVLGLLLMAGAPAASPTAGAASADPIAEMISRVQTATLLDYVRDLSGERSVLIGGTPVTIRTRYSDSGATGIDLATAYLAQHYARLGLPLETTPYGTKQWVNLIATQTGFFYPDQVYIICAHYDSTVGQGSPYDYAPGADDNASGTAAVLLAADILSQYQFAYTIRYVHFSGEEQGMWGSHAYAHQARNLNDQILGVINLDMIAYDESGGPYFDLHAKTPASERLARTFEALVTAYRLNLTVTTFTGNLAMGRSDHASFWDEQYPALLAIEDEDDFNECYHQTCDRVDRFNLAYFTNAVKAALGTLATLAQPLDAPAPTLTPTATATPWVTPACPNLVQNGDFEANPSGAPWRSVSQAGASLISPRNPHGGLWSAWLGQYNYTEDRLCQRVTLPADATDISLEYWWQLWTDQVTHNAQSPDDWLEVQIWPAGAVEPTVLHRVTDGALQHVWLPERHSLQAYAGQSVDICFVARNGLWWLSHFFVDDVRVNICGVPMLSGRLFHFPLVVKAFH